MSHIPHKFHQSEVFKSTRFLRTHVPKSDKQEFETTHSFRGPINSYHFDQAPTINNIKAHSFDKLLWESILLYPSLASRLAIFRCILFRDTWSTSKGTQIAEPLPSFKSYRCFLYIFGERQRKTMHKSSPRRHWKRTQLFSSLKSPQSAIFSHKKATSLPCLLVLALGKITAKNNRFVFLENCDNCCCFLKFETK